MKKIGNPFVHHYGYGRMMKFCSVWLKSPSWPALTCSSNNSKSSSSSGNGNGGGNVSTTKSNSCSICY